jgi:hypothetical protein
MAADVRQNPSVVAFRRPAATSGGQLDIELLGSSRQDRALSEAVPWNNTAIAAIRTAN